jgi:hypothetical protein
MDIESYERHVVGVAETSGASVIHVPAPCITGRIAERLHGLDKVVHGNDAVDAVNVRRVLLAGADRLSTNDVAGAVAAVRDNRLPDASPM